MSATMDMIERARLCPFAAANDGASCRRRFPDSRDEDWCHVCSMHDAYLSVFARRTLLEMGGVEAEVDEADRIKETVSKWVVACYQEKTMRDAMSSVVKPCNTKKKRLREDMDKVMAARYGKETPLVVEVVPSTLYLVRNKATTRLREVTDKEVHDVLVVALGDARKLLDRMRALARRKATKDLIVSVAKPPRKRKRGQAAPPEPAPKASDWAALTGGVAAAIVEEMTDRLFKAPSGRGSLVTREPSKTAMPDAVRVPCSEVPDDIQAMGREYVAAQKEAKIMSTVRGRMVTSDAAELDMSVFEAVWGTRTRGMPTQMEQKFTVLPSRAKQNGFEVSHSIVGMGYVAKERLETRRKAAAVDKLTDAMGVRHDRVWNFTELDSLKGDLGSIAHRFAKMWNTRAFVPPTRFVKFKLPHGAREAFLGDMKAAKQRIEAAVQEEADARRRAEEVLV